MADKQQLWKKQLRNGSNMHQWTTGKSDYHNGGAGKLPADNVRRWTNCGTNNIGVALTCTSGYVASRTITKVALAATGGQPQRRGG